MQGNVSIEALCDIHFIGIFACERDICWVWCLCFSKYPIPLFADVKVLQAAQDITASKDVFVELFDRVRYFLKWLEIDTEVNVHNKHSHRYHGGSLLRKSRAFYDESASGRESVERTSVE